MLALVLGNWNASGSSLVLRPVDPKGAPSEWKQIAPHGRLSAQFDSSLFLCLLMRQGRHSASGGTLAEGVNWAAENKCPPTVANRSLSSVGPSRQTSQSSMGLEPR